MFKKVLIAEDQQSINKGLISILKDLEISHVDASDNCDNALLKIKASLVKKKPFDLLITDLSFKEDHALKSHIKSGEALIEQIKKIQPHLKIIVFSIENRLGKIKLLFEKHAINAYVVKGRRESEDLKKAIQCVTESKTYYSESIRELLKKTDNISQVTSSDTLILKLLAEGLKQKQIPEYFKKNNIPSGSKRSIEYRLQELKIIFAAETLPQLIAIVKDIGLI